VVKAYNDLVLWVTTEIVQVKKVDKRSKVVAHFISIAQKCMEYNNFNSCFAIIGGLGNPAISRLTATWEKLNKQAKTSYSSLQKFCDQSYNYKNYRETLMISKPPILPYIALLGKYIFAVEENNSNFIKDTTWINMDKMRLLWSIIRQVKQYQAEDYKYKIHNDIRAYLKNMKPLSEDEAYNKSLICEARKN